MKPIQKLKSMINAEKRCEKLETQLSINNESIREQKQINKKIIEENKELKQIIKNYKEELKSVTKRDETKELKRQIKELKSQIVEKEFNKLRVEKNLDYLNYLICRLNDIDFYSNVAVFQTKFERGTSWRHPKTTSYNNLETFQKDYLMMISDFAEKVLKFVEIKYAEELEDYNKNTIELIEPEKEINDEYGN